MASRKRLTKREIRRDPIIERTLLAWRYLIRHRNRAVTVALAIIAVLVIVWGGSSYRKSRVTDAETLLGRALMQIQSGQRAEATELLQQLAGERTGTLAGKRAALYLAQIKFEERDFAAARELFERFRRHGLDDPFLKASAAKGVADCDAELGKLVEAGEEYLAVGTQFRDGPLAPDCLYLAGLAFSRVSDVSRAEEALTRLVELFPDYARIGDARILLGELQATQRRLGN